MKQYIILAESITTYRDKQLLKGSTYPETEFIAAHIQELLDLGLIEEYTGTAKPVALTKDPLEDPDAE